MFTLMFDIFNTVYNQVMYLNAIFRYLLKIFADKKIIMRCLTDRSN